MIFTKICIIGVGLIGGSIARATRQQGLCNHIVAFGRQSGIKNLQLAKQLGVIDEYFLDIETAVKDADCVIIATPVGAIKGILKQLQPYWNKQTIYTDTGSTKTNVVAAAQSVFTEIPANFIPTHPIAGTEKSGVKAATVDLFTKKRLVITPVNSTSTVALNKIILFWEKIGSSVSTMDADYHDTVLAATSHLPHILVFALITILGEKDEQTAIFKYAGGGLKDFTRIAASDPTMWADICLANKNKIIPLLQQLQTELNDIKSLLTANNSQQLFKTFSNAKLARQRLLHQFKATTLGDTFNIQPGGCLRGETRVPGDKSMSHRSIMLGSLAEGVTRISGFLEAEDALATILAFRSMGVEIIGPYKGKVTIYGVGKHGLKPPKEPLYLGNSGTSMRLLSGVLAGQTFVSILTGDKSLETRPMYRVTKPLVTMGARIKTQAGTAPLNIAGTKQLKGIDYIMPIASAQVKSCLLLAGMYATGETTITEPASTRDHTEKMLNGFLYPVRRIKNKVSINSAGILRATEIDIPGDISSAAFFLVGASIAPNSEVLLKHIGINPTRTGIIKILRLMGANIEITNKKSVGGEDVADILVVSSQLKGIDIPEYLIPLSIDELPVLFIAAACAQGQTKLTGAQELRVKESDRIQVMARGLQILGVNARPTEDGMIIQGKPVDSISGGIVDSQGDHRIAMAFFIAGLRATETVTVKNCINVNTSFPEFATLATTLGLILT